MTQFIDAIRAHPTVWNWIKLIVITVITAAVMVLLLRAEKRVAKKLLGKYNNINFHFVDSIIRFVMIVIAVMWIVTSSPITQPFGRLLFQGTAIIGAIVGFAAQPVIADLICGLMISTTQPFNIGDRIELDNGVSGIVKDITLRHVVLQTIDTIRVVIPNSKLNGMQVTNMSFHTATRSLHFLFNVSYRADPDSAKAVIRQAVEESPYSIPGKPGTGGGEYGPVYFLQYAESSLVMATTVYFEPTTPTERVRDDINTRVKHALERSGIEIPYNTVSVVMDPRSSEGAPETGGGSI